jgi:superfamily I DNA/RNA helicase
VFNGAEPKVVVVDDVESEAVVVSTWLTERIHQGVQPSEVAIFVRSDAGVARAQRAIRRAGLSWRGIGDELGNDGVLLATMHAAKGLSSVPSPSLPATTK